MQKKPKLLLFPFAGGNCYSFQFLTPFLKEFDVFPLELPGRGQRITENLLSDFESAWKDYLNQVNQILDDGPFMFYGHSLGTYMILRVTHELERMGKQPVCVVLSGNAGPGTDHNRRRHELTKENFVEELRRLGGVPEELIENEEMFAFFEPVLRSDFKIVSDCDLEGKLKIKTPVYALMGDKEELSVKLDNWGNYTEGAFFSQILPGDHFFIHKHPEKISGILKSFYVENKMRKHTAVLR